MSVYLSQLRERQERVRSELRALAAKPDALSREERRRERELDDEDRTILQEIADEEERERQREAIRHAVERAGGSNLLSGDGAVHTRPEPAGGRPETREARLRIDALHRADLLGDLDAKRCDKLIAGDRTGLSASIFEALADPDYSRAFAKILSDPLNGHREFSTRELAAFQRAQQLRSVVATGFDTAGGFLVPTHLDPSVLLSNDGTLSPLREISRVVTLTMSNVWNGVTSDGVVASYANELDEVTDGSPEFAGPSIPVHRAHAFVSASFEAMHDIGGLAGEVATMFRDARDQLEADKLANGTSGETAPTGVFWTAENTAATHVASSTQGELHPVDVYTLRQALAPRWRPRGTFAADGSVIDHLEQLETPNAADRAFPSLPEGRLVRRPIVEDSNFRDLAFTTSGTQGLLMYGDFRNFVVVDRVPTMISPVQHLFGANRLPIGAGGWYFLWRSGSDVVINSAFKLLVDGSN